MLAVERISGGTPMPMLAEMIDVEFNAAASYVFAQSTGVLKKYPQEFFTSKDAAITWLTEVVAVRG